MKRIIPRISSISRNHKNRKKWISLVHEVANTLYGENVCCKVKYKRIVIYAPKSQIYSYINSIVSVIALQIGNTDTIDIIEDISIVFDDGNNSCDWKISQLMELNGILCNDKTLVV